MARLFLQEMVEPIRLDALPILQEFADAKRDHPSLFKARDLTVFYYRSDNLSDDQKARIIDFRNYDDAGK